MVRITARKTTRNEIEIEIREVSVTGEHLNIRANVHPVDARSFWGELGQALEHPDHPEPETEKEIIP